jgi:hypothetical protein
MAQGKASKVSMLKALPIWTTDHSETVHMAFESMMHGIGVTDLASYWRQMKLSISVSAIVCALYGATSYGLTGMLLGALLGITLPAALLWFAVLLLGIVLYLTVYCLAWAAILTVGWSLLTGAIGG